MTMVVAIALTKTPHANGQVQPLPTPSLVPSPSSAASSTPSQSPSPGESPLPSATPGVTPTPVASPTPTPTPPPITVQPEAAQVPVGLTQQLNVGAVVGPITAVAQNPDTVDVAVNQDTDVVTLTGKAPGSTIVTISDARGLSKDVPVTVAYQAGTVPPQLSLRITGDPASADYVRTMVAQTIAEAAQLRPGAQVVVGPSDVPFNGRLDQDTAVDLNVNALIQGEQYFTVTPSTRVHVEDIAVPRISPSSLMVSDFPELLTENGVLFTAKLQHGAPSRFLYFHYNPSSQPDRRIVLRAENDSDEPAIVQFIRGSGGPDPNEMEAGHDATKEFLVRLVQNEGTLITIGAKSSLNLVQQDLPSGQIVCSLLQLRVLSGGEVGLTLFAQNASDDPNAPVTETDLLVGSQRHARGIYSVPEFHHAVEWNVNDPYLELPIGQLALPNNLQGEALAGDYGVLQSFVVNVENPMPTSQAIAIYENPRGGRATGTYLIDGVLVQSHQAPPFSRYKLRQYVVPARGFVRVTIVTMTEGGSSYPLRLIFAPDDGSIAPGAPGSPIY